MGAQPTLEATDHAQRSAKTEAERGEAPRREPLAPLAGTSARTLAGRLRGLSPGQVLDLHGVLGNRAVASRRASPPQGGLLANVHTDVAARVRHAFPASAPHVALRSGFAGMGAVQGSLGDTGLLGASRGADVALAPALHRELQTANPSPLAEKTLYHELAHTRQRAPTPPGAGAAPQLLHDPRNEAEADATAERAYRGHRVESPHAAFTGGPRRTQRSMTAERRAAESRRNYAEAAKLYELHIGAVLREDPESHAAADLLLTELQPITTAWAQSTGQALDRVLEASYGWSGGDRYYGAFRMTARNINHVFQQAATRPLREKLKIGYNAIRNNNLAKWLKVAAQQLFMQINMPLAPRDISVENVDDTTTENVDANFAANSGLALKMIADPQHYLEAFNAAVLDEPNLGVPVHRTGKHKFSRALAWSPQVQFYNFDRVGGMNRGRDPLRMSPLKMKDIELTDFEIEQIGINQKLLRPDEHDANRLRAFHKSFRSQNARGNRPLPWEKGTGYYDVLIGSQTEQLASTVGARLLAGVSGSTDLMLHAAQHLGFPVADQYRMRLAMLGWMLETEDHSFFEILEAGLPYNLTFERGARPGEMYEQDDNFRPKDAADFRISFRPQIADAPDEPSYPSALLDPTYIDEIKLKDPNVSLPAYRKKYGDLGVPAAILRAFTATDMADVEQVDLAIQKAPLKRGAGKNQQPHNFQVRRGLRGTRAFIDLVHRHPLHAELILDHLIAIRFGEHALGGYETTMLASAEHLPDAGADVAERRQALIDAGVPAAIVDGMQQVDRDIAIQLRAFVRNLGLDAADDRDAPARRANSVKLRRLRQMRPYTTLAGRIGAILDVLLAAFLAELSPSLRTEGLSLANTAPEQQALLDLGVPEAIAVTLDPANVGLAKRLAGRARTQANRPGTITARYNELWALAADATFAGLSAAIGVHNVRIIIFSAARVAGLDLAAVATAATKKKTLPGFTYATLGEVLQSSSVVLDQAGRDAVKEQALARNFPGPMRNTGLRELDETRQRMQDNLDDVVTGARYTDVQKQQYLGLDPIEVFGINQYTQHYGMGVWQGMLAGRDAATPWTGVGEKSPQEQAWVMKAAVSGLNRLPPFSGTVYNGQPLPLIALGPGGTYLLDQVQAYANINYFPGRQIRQDTFFSTARSIGASFISKATHNLAWVIESVRTGRDIQPISDKPGEEEVLFPPGARFMVQWVDTSKINLTGGDPLAGKLVVHLIEI